MEKKIIYTENAPDKKFLWLHTKNNNLVLEVFGNHGWESVGNENDNTELLINRTDTILTILQDENGSNNRKD